MHAASAKRRTGRDQKPIHFISGEDDPDKYNQNKNDEIITINVGGERFQTFDSTLASNCTSMISY